MEGSVVAIEITKRPFYYCFCGNPVHYQLYSAMAINDAAVFFQVRILFKAVGAVDFIYTEAFPYSPVDGFAEADIQDILEGFLEYDLPKFGADETTIWPAPRQTGFFYIQYREITAQNPDPSWDGSEGDYQCLAVKGGISRFKYQGNNFFANYFNADVPGAQRPFLTWQQSGRLAALTERMYLGYLLIDEVTANNLKLKIKTTYTDGSNLTVTQAVPVIRARIYYLPVGAHQRGLHLITPAKDIWFWEVWLENTFTTEKLSQVFKYEADNRQDYNDLTLHYRNSLGCLDSVRLRGAINNDLDYDYAEVQKIQRPDYFVGHFFDPQKVIANNKEVKTIRSDIGHLEKEEQDRLRDVYLKRETWWEVAKKWWPVTVLNKNIKLTSSESNRWGLPLDFTLAHDGDSHYTPDSVDLGVGTLPSNVCRASLGNIEVNKFDGNGFNHIEVDFLEVDPEDASNQMTWRVFRRSDNSIVYPWATVPMVSPLAFDLSDDEEVFLEMRAVCGNTVTGKKSTALINTGTIPPPPSGGTSVIVNNTAHSMFFELRRNDDVILNSQFVGDNSEFRFDTVPGSNLIFRYETAGNFSPSSAVIYNGPSTMLNGTITSLSGFSTRIEFPPINVVDGIKIKFD